MKGRVELENPYIMVVGSKISRTSEIVPVLELVKKTGRPLLLFSAELQKDPLSTLVYHSSKGLVTSCAVNIPWQAGEEKELLKDIAILTGATFIDNVTIKSAKNVTLEALGSCSRATISSSQTQILGARGSKDKLSERVQELKMLISPNNKEISFSKRKIIQDRISRLAGLVGIFYVGGETEVVRNEVHDKIVDSLNACKGAIDKGIVPGGGAALVHAAKNVTSKLVLNNLDQKKGASIVQAAASMPMRMILINAGVNDKIVLNQVKEQVNYWYGYDVKEGMLMELIKGIGKLQDMWKAGVWDSLKVVQTYLKDAISIAGLVISTECIAVKKKGYTRNFVILMELAIPLQERMKEKEFF